LSIVGDECRLFGLGLSDQHAIERVVVMWRQVG
jgi:hypothetical protein